MKKVVLGLILMFFLLGNSWATPPDFIPPGHQYGGQGGSSDVDVSVKTTITDIDIISVDNKITNSSKADAKSASLSGAAAFNDLTIIQEKELLAAPGIGVPETNFIVGETSRYNLLPKFANITAYNNEQVSEILYYNDGSVFGRVTPREVPAIILKESEPYKGNANIRYDVICRKASHTLNIGTGGATSASGNGGINSGSILGIAGGGWSIADAYCTIWIYKVQ